ncbi:MAG: hypothetical protein JO303_00480 [Caulobacteraceae bacterium]|nr:hypothetical protein [Caulobacteraceae bacterium]
MKPSPVPLVRPRIEAGDGLVVVGRTGSRMNAIFSALAKRVRAGRTQF